MAVNNTGNINPIMPQNVPDLKNNKPVIPQNENEKLEGGRIIDRVEISKQAKAISKAVINIKNMEEVRNNLVEEVRQNRVEENQRIPAYLLAARMLLED